MSYWNRDPVELRRLAAERLVYIRSGGLERDKRREERRKAAEKEARLARRERRKEITHKVRLLRRDLKEQETLYDMIEADKADIGIRDAAHKQGALEEVQYTADGITRQINKLLDERDMLHD